MGTESNMTTAFRPQADGQTERVNQELEQYLQHYVSYHQDNWVELLPYAQMAWNSTVLTVTNETPHFVEYGKEVTPRRTVGDAAHAVGKPVVAVGDLPKIYDTLREDVRFFKEKAKAYYDRKKVEGPTLSRGDRVYLLRRNLKTKRPSEKLSHVRIGPFKIIDKIGEVNFKLELPRTMKQHPVFHESLLE